jgi:hypothetical protein
MEVRDREGNPEQYKQSAVRYVRVHRSAEGLELRIEGRFEPGDIAAIKRLPGRRWNPVLRRWILPDNADTIGELERCFGSRLRVHTVADAAVEQVRTAVFESGAD